MSCTCAYIHVHGVQLNEVHGIIKYIIYIVQAKCMLPVNDNLMITIFIIICPIKSCTSLAIGVLCIIRIMKIVLNTMEYIIYIRNIYPCPIVVYISTCHCSPFRPARALSRLAFSVSSSSFFSSFTSRTSTGTYNTETIIHTAVSMAVKGKNPSHIPYHL